MSLNNPYLDRAHKSMALEDADGRIPLGVGNRDYETRGKLTRQFAWAIPNDQAIETLVKHSPIVEIGAGTGYWASLVEQAGGDIVAYDWAPPNMMTNYFHRPDEPEDSSTREIFFDVRLGSAGDIRNRPDRTLFLCWPPYGDEFAWRCLDAYKGEYFIFVGEDSGGCTGDDKFFAELDANWTFVEMISIPQWWAIHDYMYVYQRSSGPRKRIHNRCRYCKRFAPWTLRSYERCEHCDS